ncbi:hypothetical protein GJAV_G00271370 [Gymnothorax javanicus]|nr:hypothetical protein GJAV_G00271370 [Gymnothorax javanicus]
MGKAASLTAFSMAKPASLGRVKCQRISKGITYYVREAAADSGPSQGCPGTARPLLLLFPWLHAQPQAVGKYMQAYSRTGCDMLMVETDVSKFLWPRWGLDYGAQVLEVLQSDQFVSRPLLVHAFSIGGFTFSQLLMHMSLDTQRYQCLMDRIKGHVYDSLVIGSLDHMAVGLGKSILPRWEGVVRWTALLYFRASKRFTVDNFAAGIEVFWNSPIKAPALFFFCENDVMSDHKQLEELIEYWRKRGVTVHSKKWAESRHAGHLRRHPEEYLSTLDNFLLSINMTPLRAKM